jgi:hypothetical protein
MSRTPKINQSEFRLSEHVTLNYVARPAYGVTLEQVMDEAYWGHVSSLLKAGYTIECMPEALTWYAKLIVVDAGPVHAKVKLLQFVDLVDQQSLPEQSPMPERLDLGKFQVAREGAWWRVLRVADKEVMRKGFRTMAAAQAWALDNLQVDVA